jgi:predicted LPLAT superfamily acyltransferase
LTGAKWSGRSRGTPLGYRIFIFLIKHAGVRAAYALLLVVAPWYVLTARSSNAALRRYFRRVRAIHPGAGPLSPLRSYLSFGRTLIDRSAMRAGLASRYTFTFDGEHHLRGMVAAGTGGLVISAHVGNWELASHLLRERQLPVSVVMADTEAEGIKKVLDQAAVETPVDVIALRDDLSHLIRIRAALAEGRILCFNGDRHLPGARTIKADLLGAAAEFPLGPFALARTLGTPVSFSFVLNTAPMTYAFRATPPLPRGTDPQAMVDRFAAELERTVLTHPRQWFNFFDFWNDDERPTAGHR